jgi:flagellin
VLATAEGALNEVSALLLDLQGLIVESANEAGLADEEVAANQLQIDSILASIDRIANTTEFAGRRLLNGDLAYNLSSIPSTAFTTVHMHSVHLPPGATRPFDVRVTQSAQTARLDLVGSSTSATTVQIRGNLGAELLTFASGTTISQIETAINSITPHTGVSASVSGGGALILRSTEYGSDAYVSVEPLSGRFVSVNSGTSLRDEGVDVGLSVNGQVASGRGLKATVRGGLIDADLILTEAFAQTLSSATFHAVGGGGVFQITAQVNQNGQVPFALDSIHTTQLGNEDVGLLYSLGTGNEHDLAGKRFENAQRIVDEAISQVAFLRGRVGNMQRNQIETNINSQGIALENITAAESAIRDADVAEEVSALTRAQILVQSTQNTLKIANSLPGMVLTLLQ